MHSKLSFFNPYSFAGFKVLCIIFETQMVAEFQARQGTAFYAHYVFMLLSLSRDFFIISIIIIWKFG